MADYNSLKKFQGAMTSFAGRNHRPAGSWGWFNARRIRNRRHHPRCRPARRPHNCGGSFLAIQLRKMFHQFHRPAAASTSACDNFPRPMPAAGLVIPEIAATFNPHCRATIASGTVLIPTASAPNRAKARISAGVS